MIWGKNRERKTKTFFHTRSGDQRRDHLKRKYREKRQYVTVFTPCFPLGQNLVETPIDIWNMWNHGFTKHLKYHRLLGVDQVTFKMSFMGRKKGHKSWRKCQKAASETPKRVYKVWNRFPHYFAILLLVMKLTIFSICLLANGVLFCEFSIYNLCPF